jgi:3-dehydroquinate synthetase
VEARIAEALGIAPAGLAVEIANSLRAAMLPTMIPNHLELDALVAATRGDKKNRGGSVRYALPCRIGAMSRGDGTWVTPVDDSVVLSALAGGAE